MCLNQKPRLLVSAQPCFLTRIFRIILIQWRLLAATTHSIRIFLTRIFRIYLIQWRPLAATTHSILVFFNTNLSNYTNSMKAAGWIGILYHMTNMLLYKQESYDIVGAAMHVYNTRRWLSWSRISRSIRDRIVQEKYPFWSAKRIAHQIWRCHSQAEI